MVIKAWSLRQAEEIQEKMIKDLALFQRFDILSLVHKKTNW